MPIQISKKFPVLQFHPDDWFTPRSYSDNYREIPDSPGIYAFVRVTLNYKANPKIFHKVLYIGQSKHISRRLKSHCILSQLIKNYGHNEIFIYFLPISKNLRKTEKRFIRALNPPFNLQHRTRGVE